MTTQHTPGLLALIEQYHGAERVYKALPPTDAAFSDALSAKCRLALAIVPAAADLVPELVEALRLALREHDSHVHDQYDGTSQLANFLAAVDPARAVLAKVTGGEA